MFVNWNVWHRSGMAREDLHFRLRIPEDLKVQVSAAADANKRSMTAEIIARLEASFSPVGTDDLMGIDSPKAAAMAERIVERVIGRVMKISADAEERIKALEEDNRSLRQRLSD